MEALNKGKSSIMLVPEIILTPQNIERFKEAFGSEVVLMHSGLSASERFQAYYDFNSGRKKIIVGPRSALLVPSSNIGLIIIDEEHEDAYKQDMSPRYHTVQLAEIIARQQKAILVLGSATPNIESFYKAQISEFNLHKIDNRYNKLLLPPAEIVDLKNEIRSGNNSVISQKLLSAIDLVLKQKKQAILFLNRRGSSTFVSCRECGEVLNCPNCSIPLVHHNSSYDYLYCHHCNYRSKVPAKCPKCLGAKIKFFGAGVEKVEHEIKQLFPKARVVRIDAETMKNKKDHHSFYQDFKNHRFDIAIGTQMISKGFDIPNVDLVGIISADTGLHLPYFRASEKIFRLITQVSGRSGRNNNIGKTIIQTYWPNSRAVQFASKHDYLGFYQQEIANREKHSYPPFSRIIRVVSEHEEPKKSLLALEKIIPQLEEIGLEYLGPAPCFLQRLRNKWRYHVIIKLKNPSTELRAGSETEELKNNLREIWKNNLNLIWDVDPNDLL
jgi:primosomal protein N' (replication factor Y)